MAKVYAILGPIGSGKTTLELILGEYPNNTIIPYDDDKMTRSARYSTLNDTLRQKKGKTSIFSERGDMLTHYPLLENHFSISDAHNMKDAFKLLVPLEILQFCQKIMTSIFPKCRAIMVSFERFDTKFSGKLQNICENSSHTPLYQQVVETFRRRTEQVVTFRIQRGQYVIDDSPIPKVGNYSSNEDAIQQICEKSDKYISVCIMATLYALYNKMKVGGYLYDDETHTITHRERFI